MLSSIFEKFVQDSPVSVMARGLMERIFAPERMDKLFENHARVQYQQDLLFSSQVDLMSLVVCGRQKSVHAAYKAKATNSIVSTTALYKKLCGVELGVSQALVRETAQDLRSLISLMGGEQPNSLPGYQLRIVDGICLAATDHRLNAIRLFAAKALPGKAIVHGVGKIDAGLSDFYLVDEIQGTYRGMMIAISQEHWQAFETFSLEQMVLVLQDLAARVELKCFLKAIRGVKKKREPLVVDSKHRHISTARLLDTHHNAQNKS